MYSQPSQGRAVTEIQTAITCTRQVMAVEEIRLRNPNGHGITRTVPCIIAP